MVEPALPEPGHLARPVDQRGQRTELRAIVRLAAFVAVAHQPGLLQDPEMLRDGRLRDPGLSRQGAKYGWQQFFGNLEQVLARTD